MLKRLILAALLAATVLAIAAAAAGASTTSGNTSQSCSGLDEEPGLLLTDSTDVITTSGVITKWGFPFPSGTGTIPPLLQRLVVLAPGATANSWTVVNSDSTLDVAWGGASTNVRIPVSAGQRIALYSADDTFYCTSADPSVATVYETLAAAPADGSTATVIGGPSGIVANIYATVEADADHDGYGDETQDACPQSAKLQTPCPTPTLSATAIPYAKGFRAAVVTDIPGAVVASGLVKLPKSKGKKAKTLKFKSKSVATTPGVLKQVTLKWPSALKTALKSLSPSKKLKASITVTAPGVLSNSTKKFTVKLPGTGH